LNIFFIFSVIIMIATPGPVMILVASAGLKGGYKKALKPFLVQTSPPLF
jgi:threonine/homoserine/homoserine lactone efflux protein